MLHLIHSQWVKDAKQYKDLEYLKDYYSNIFENIYHKTSVNKKYDFLVSPSYNYSIPGDSPNILVHNSDIDDKYKIENDKTKTKKVSKALDKVQFSSIYNNRKFKFIITPGNNSKLIREALKRRSWWVEIPNFNTVFNFKWQPTSYKLKYKDLGKERNLRQMVNHLEYHKSISEKSELFKNLQIYCEQTRSNVFKVTPLTFFVTIDISKPNALNSSLAAFETIFNLFEHTKKYFRDINEKYKSSSDYFVSKKHLGVNLLKPSHKNKKDNAITKFKTFNFHKRGHSYFTKYEMPLSHYVGHNFWLLKPTNLNRGRGIHVFSDLKSWRKLIEEYCRGIDRGKQNYLFL